MRIVLGVDASEPSRVAVRLLSGHTVRSDSGHVHDREPMMLVIIGQKRKRRVLALHARIKDRLVPREHLVEPPGHIHDMR